jgi:hypothetical protein
VEPGPRHLEYAPPQPARDWRRILRRWGVVLLVLALVTWAALQFGVPIYHNLAHLRRQRAAIAHVPAARHVVSRGQQGPPYSRGGPGYSVSSTPPQPWSNFIAAAYAPALPVAFLGELHTRSGRRIVVIRGQIFYRPPQSVSTLPAWASPPMGNYHLGLSAYVLRPGSVTAPPAVLRNPSGLGTTLPADFPVQLFAGRPDPNDPSRFVIEYQHGRERSVIDGRLRDDDTVDLAVRVAPPVAPP